MFVYTDIVRYSINTSLQLLIGIPLFVTHIGGETMVTCMQRLWHYKGSQRVHQKFVQYNSE